MKELSELRFVGDKTASVLAADDIDPSDIERKRVSFTQLVEAGVNPGVAARIRRAHSLSWSFESSGEDLERRSAQVRGLGDDERAWVAASSGDWETAEAKSSGDWEPTKAANSRPTNGTAKSEDVEGADDPVAAEAAWREQSRLTPVTVLDDIDEEMAAILHEGGIISVRRLATVDADRVADALELDEDVVRQWRDAARSHQD